MYAKSYISLNIYICKLYVIPYATYDSPYGYSWSYLYFKILSNFMCTKF